MSNDQDIISPEIHWAMLKRWRDEKIAEQLRVLRWQFENREEIREINRWFKKCQRKIEYRHKTKPSMTPECLALAIGGWVLKTTGKEFITLAELERIYTQLVIENSASFDQASKILGIDPATLWRRREKAGILNLEPTAKS